MISPLISTKGSPQVPNGSRVAYRSIIRPRRDLYRSIVKEFNGAVVKKTTFLQQCIKAKCSTNLDSCWTHWSTDQWPCSHCSGLKHWPVTIQSLQWTNIVLWEPSTYCASALDFVDRRQSLFTTLDVCDNCRTFRSFGTAFYRTKSLAVVEKQHNAQ